MLTTRKNLIVEIDPPGGTNPLRMRLSMNPVKVGSALIIVGYLIAQGGAPAYAYSISSGSLPTHMLLDSATGAISVTGSLTAGKTLFVAEVQDSATTIFQSTFEIDIDHILQPVFASPLPFENGFAYQYQFGVDGFTGTLTWSIGSGSLPTGVSVNSSTGLLSGTPTSTAPADFSFVVHVADSGTGDAIDIPCNVHEYEQFKFISLNVGGFTLVTGIPQTGTHIGYVGGAPPFSTAFVQAYDGITLAPIAIPDGLSIIYGTTITGSNLHFVTVNATQPFTSALITFKTTDSLGHSPTQVGEFFVSALNAVPSTDVSNALSVGSDGGLFASGGSGSSPPDFVVATLSGGSL